MNRQTKRQMARQGTDKPRAADRRPATPAPTRERTTPRQYLSEVRGELRKVSWPTRAEVTTSSIVVLLTVVFMMTLIALFDIGASKFVLFLFGD